MPGNLWGSAIKRNQRCLGRHHGFSGHADGGWSLSSTPKAWPRFRNPGVGSQEVSIPRDTAISAGLPSRRFTRIAVARREASPLGLFNQIASVFKRKCGGASMWRAFGGLLFIFFAGATLMSAQAERASLTGNATDKSGAALAGVHITVLNEATNTSLAATTDSAGAYSVLNLIPGKYTVNASLNGFGPVV